MATIAGKSTFGAQHIGPKPKRPSYASKTGGSGPGADNELASGLTQKVPTLAKDTGTTVPAMKGKLS